MPNPRTPTHLKVVRGTTRKDRSNPDEPKAPPAPATITPPPWLDLSPLAKKAWADLVPMLLEMGVLAKVDATALALLCDALAFYVTAKKVVAREGATYESIEDVDVGEDDDKRPATKRMIRAHPAVAAAGENARFAKAMLSEFGLTPAARSKVSTGKGGEKDGLDKWLSGTGS